LREVSVTDASDSHEVIQNTAQHHGDAMQEYKITPHVGVGTLRFDMSRTQAHAVLGPPLSTKKSRFADEFRDFWEENGLQLIFAGPDKTLVEIGLYPNLLDVEFNGVKLFSPKCGGEKPVRKAYLCYLVRKCLHTAYIYPQPTAIKSLNYGMSLILMVGLP
jgi:hypothetical protein